MGNLHLGRKLPKSAFLLILWCCFHRKLIEKSIKTKHILLEPAFSNIFMNTCHKTIPLSNTENEKILFVFQHMSSYPGVKRSVKIMKYHHLLIRVRFFFSYHQATRHLMYIGKPRGKVHIT